MKRYEPKLIEPKWQKIWDETGVYNADLNSDKPKYIAMGMFNYPSGDLHIGHSLNFTISDIKARYMRQRGYESYHPVGWDSFGLPAENRAIKMGISPQESMADLIPKYRTSYKAMGWSNDWEKEISTHLPEYYKWTQWIFSEMYRAGLAYQEERQQWWCDQCQTVLANEQVLDGKCWRHDGDDDPLVEKRGIKQWFFKITDYADELLEAIDDLDWTDSVKTAQRNWIGRSTGAEVTFALDSSNESIRVFTTRIDTIFGATFLVVAPESELVDQITTAQQQKEVEDYRRASGLKSEVERQASKEKTGVFTGSYAINPANGKKIPIWIADYVLGGYGTGAIMAVPAHDERDNEFAKKFNLDIIEVINNSEDSDSIFTGHGTLTNSDKFVGQSSKDAQPKIIEWLAEKGAAEQKVNFKMRDWSVSRQRYWGAPIPVVYCDNCGPQLLPDKSLPVILPELEDFAPSGDGRSALARAKDWLVSKCPNCDGPAERETDTLDTYICSSWYMLRYFDPHNQQMAFDPEITKKWMPIDFYNGGDHATAHLLYARFITRYFHKKGMVNSPEPFKQFLFNGKITAHDGTMFSKSKGNGVDPLEIIAQGYGADSLRVYLMFASPLELWTKWDPQGVPGAYRFLNRLFNLVQEYLESPAQDDDANKSIETELLRATHKMIQKVNTDIESSNYNTAISKLMETLNTLFKLKVDNLAKTDTWRQSIEAMVMCTAPFAPFMAEELWQQLGHSDSIHTDHWPVLDEKYLIADVMKLAIQVNGKVRAEIEVDADESEDKIKEISLSQENVIEHLKGNLPKKVIYVKDRLVSVVV